MDDSNQPNVVRKLHVRLMLSIGAIGVIAMVGAFLVESLAHRQEKDAMYVNVAGRQRLLSQQLVTFALLLQDTSDSSERERIRIELKETLDHWTQVHDALLHPSGDRWLSERDDTLNRRGVELQFLAVRNAALKLLSLAKASDGIDREGMSRTVTAIRAHQPPYLNGMDSIVDEYTLAAADHVGSARIANGSIALTTLVLLTFITRCVYAPAGCTIRRQIEDLQEAAEARREKQELAIVYARLKESESRFRTLLDSTAEGIYGLNLRGNCTFANAACLRLLGYDDVSEVLGKNMHALIHHTRCDGTPYPVEQCCIYEAFQKGKGTHVDSEVLWRADGTSFASEYWSFPMSKDGQLIGSVVTFLDITERREIQQVLRKSEAQVLYGAVAEAAETDCFEDALESCIRRVCRLTGWPVGHVYVPVSDQYILEPTTIWHVDDGYDCASFCEVTEQTTFAMGIGLPGRIWQSGEPCWIVNVQSDNNFPRARVCEDINVKGAFGFPVKIKDEIVAVLEFFTKEAMDPDEALLLTAASVGELVGRVLERQNANAELLRAKGAAEAANRAKSEFLASMSHELRTPLNGVIGMTELLAGTELNGKQRQFVHACHASGEALLHLINDILDFSKIEAGKSQLHLREFDLTTLVTDIVEAVSIRAADKNLELSCYVDQMSRLVVKGDCNRLRQILVNLVGNAIKFTKSGEVVVRTATTTRQADRITVRFSVCDTGIGIPTDKLDDLFQLFSRVDASTTQEHGGTGLGLALTRKLVGLMGGTIGVESEEGVGSTFWFEVPLELLSESTDIRSKLASIEANTKPTLNKNGYVLLVEDDNINQIYMIELLGQLNCACEAVASGREAIDAVQQRKYNLVLMDCQMPEMDGFEATRRIRQLESDGTLDGHLPIVALTANAVKGDRQRCLDAGMDDYFSKPVQKHHVANVLERFVCDTTAPSLETEAAVVVTGGADRLPETTPIDAKSLLARCFGNVEFAGSLLDELESTGMQRVNEIRQCAAGQDADATADAAHALKGAAGILCAETMQKLAAEIEQAGRSAAIEKVEAELEDLVAEMQRCLEYVPQLRREMNMVTKG